MAGPPAKFSVPLANLGIFNPRLNEVYLLNVNTISKEIITEVERDVICY